MKAEKCHFMQEQVTYLGYIIFSKGIEPDKQFMGISNYYRRFIAAYAHIAEPLHRLLRKNAKTFQWTKECEASFDTLKSKLTTPPTYFSIPKVYRFLYSIHRCFRQSIGGISSQIQDGHERVIAYWSRQLTKAECNYSTIKCVTLTIVGAINKFYPYLYGFHFQLLTDYNPLTSLKT